MLKICIYFYYLIDYQKYFNNFKYYGKVEFKMVSWICDYVYLKFSVRSK